MLWPSTVRDPLGREVLRPEASDVFFYVVVLAFTFAATRVWWLSSIVPGQDYPQFLVFVRALQDHTNPASPFHGTYTVGPWFMPTSLPINLTSVLAHLCSLASGHPIEAAGKLLLTMQGVELVAATLYLLKLLGRNRWAVLLLFPIIHPQWTVVGGFAAFATSLPVTVFTWGLTVRWLCQPDRRSGSALAACLCASLMWHGIGFMQAGLGFGILWLLWRAPSWRARAIAVLPTLPSLGLSGAWIASTITGESHGGMLTWTPFWEASENVFQYLWATVPHNTTRPLALFLIVGAGLMLSPRNLGGSGAASTMWRLRNPFLLLSLAYLATYYVCPMYLGAVEGVSPRFPYVALLAFIFAWNLPAGRAARRLVLVAVGGFGLWCLQDIAARFRAFDEETRGASALMDQMGEHETLYYSPPAQGASKDFEGRSNKPMRELEQYATVRKGGLPNSSFAGYGGVNYLRYVDNRNPMPGLFGTNYDPRMTMFDYMLAREGSGPSDRRFKLVAKAEGWELYGVCGSKRFPTCR